MGKIRDIGSLAGGLLVCFYVLFTVIAYCRYPMAYSPLTNWLSDLGSHVLNPHGAVFYNTGIVITGLLIFIFFLGLRRLIIKDNRRQKAMVFVTQGFGFLGAIALIMSAVYSIDVLNLHSFWSVSMYVMLGTAFGFSVAALRYHPACPKWLLACGIIVALTDILSGVFGASHTMEWVTVALFLFYVSAIVIGTKRI